MDKQIRHVVLVVTACFVLLFAQLNRVQVFEAEELKDQPSNTRELQRDFNRPRGQIFTEDNIVVAKSTPLEDGKFIEQREYPHGNLYSHTVGYISFTAGAEGVERAYNDDLIGESDGKELAEFSDALAGRERKGDVVLTLNHSLQSKAAELLGGKAGSIVALDPRSGQIRALWSAPSYDPTPLVSHKGDTSSRHHRELAEQTPSPLRAKAYQDIFFPGSTFKVITAAAGLESGAVTLTSPEYENTTSYKLPLSSASLKNFGGSTCGGNLTTMLVKSCNAGFAEMAAEDLGPDLMVSQSEKFGFNKELPFDLANSVPSAFPTDYGNLVRKPTDEAPAGIYENSAVLAQTSIGQNDVSATPLQMALVAAAVANKGSIPSPHVVKEVRDTEGEIIREVSPDDYAQAMSPETADSLNTALIKTAESGSAKAVKTNGLEIGAKTGTAQLGTKPKRSHAWLIAYGGRPGEEPELALAVLVEADKNNPNQTGGDTAAPIAKALFEHYFANSKLS